MTLSKYETRKEKLIIALRQQTRMTVEEVSSLIETSPSTTRRFFEQLKVDGICMRFHGGIQLMPKYSSDYSHSFSNTIDIDAKTEIAFYAVNYIESGDNLFLDSGTTVIKIAEAIAEKIKNLQLKNIMVVTNSLVNYEILSPWCRVIIAGGEVRLSRKDTCGYIAEQVLESLHVNKSFFGADAVHLEKGLMATDERTCIINGILKKNSDLVYAVAGSNKFGEVSLMTYSELKDVDKIITDNKISKETLSLFREKGVEIDVAGEN